jgi:hypothetical protein
VANSSFVPTILTLPSTGGTGQGELNLVQNPVAASDTTGWTGVSRQTGGGPLNPTVSTYFQVNNSATVETATSGGYASLTLPSGLQNRKLKVEFYYTTPATDVYKVSVWKAGTRVPLTTDASGSTSLPAGTTGKFTAYFDTDSTGSWTLNVTRTSGATGPCSITQVVVGPGIQPQGAVVGEWQSYTPTGNFTGATYTGRYRRTGSDIELRIDLAFTGGAGGTATFSAAQMLNGLGLTVDTTKLPVTSDTNIPIGTWAGLDSGVNGGYNGNINFDTVNAQLVYGTSSAVTTTAPFTWGANDNIGMQIKLPIAEWAGSGTVQLAQNDVEYAWNSDPGTAAATLYNNTAYLGYGPTGTLITAINSATSNSSTSKLVRFQTPIQPGDRIQVEILRPDSTSPSVVYGNTWTPVENLSDSPAPFKYEGTAVFGIGFSRVAGSNTDIYVAFGNGGAGTYKATARTYAELNTDPWSSYATGAYKWRVRKSSAGAAVGFGIVSSSSAGLLPASNSNLEDATATRLGLKQYLHGTTYNGGIAPTVTSAQGGFTVARAAFVPYQTQDGAWRLRFNMYYAFTSATVTTVTASVNGVTFKNVSFYSQPISIAPSATANITNGYVSPNTANIIASVTSSTQTGFGLSGDVELDSKPTWAY